MDVVGFIHQIPPMFIYVYCFGVVATVWALGVDIPHAPVTCTIGALLWPLLVAAGIIRKLL